MRHSWRILSLILFTLLLSSLLAVSQDQQPVPQQSPTDGPPSATPPGTNPILPNDDTTLTNPTPSPPPDNGNNGVVDQIERLLQQKDSTDAAQQAQMQPSQPRTLRFTNQPLSRVLRIIAEQAGVNYVEPNMPDERISVTLTNLTPIQAFYRIAESRGFQVLEENGTYTLRRSDIPAPSFYVTKRYVIRNTPAEFLLQPIANFLGAKIIPAGEYFPGYPKPDNTPSQNTNALQSLGGGTGTDQSRPRYAPGLPFDAPSSTGSYTPNEQDAVFIERSSNAIVVRTTAEKQELVAEEIARMDHRERQILIKTYVVEVNDTKSSGGGVDWSSALGVKPGQGTTFTISSNTNPLTGPSIAGNLTPGAFFTNGLVLDVSNIAVTLQALQAKGRILGNNTPMTIAKSGMPVTIRSDTQQTVFLTTPGSQQYGQSTQPYTFTTGLTIDLVARILDGGLIDMNLNPALSSQTATTNSGLQTNVDVPVISTRSATANVTVRSGQAAVIGGILQDNYQINKALIPGLGKIPILGYLFKTKSRFKNRTNLIIIVSPTIISADNRRLDRVGEDEQRTMEMDSDLPGEPPPIFHQSNGKEYEYRSHSKKDKGE